MISRTTLLLILTIGFLKAQSTAEMAAEAQRDLKKKQAELKVTVTQLIVFNQEAHAHEEKEILQQQIERIKKSQAAWEAWTQLEAGVHSFTESGTGSISRITYPATLEELTTQRIAALKRLMGKLPEEPTDALQSLAIREQVGSNPVEISHRLYRGELSGSKGLFALLWPTENTVRGAFFSEDGGSAYAFYGDNYTKGKIDFELYDSKGTLVNTGSLRNANSAGKVKWSGTLHDQSSLSFTRLPKAKESTSTRSKYSGTSGSNRVSATLNWHKAGAVEGSLINHANNHSIEVMGSNYDTGMVYLDRWDQAGVDVEGGAVNGLIHLTKQPGTGIKWSGYQVLATGEIEKVTLQK